jgi:hypothetical protein
MRSSVLMRRYCERLNDLARRQSLLKILLCASTPVAFRTIRRLRPNKPEVSDEETPCFGVSSRILFARPGDLFAGACPQLRSDELLPGGMPVAVDRPHRSLEELEC